MSKALLVAAVLALGCTHHYPALDPPRMGHIQADPDAYRGQVIAVHGKVMNVQRLQDGWYAYQVYARWSNSTTNVLALYRSRKPVATNGNHLRVLGTVSGRLVGTNAFGGPTTLVGMQVFALSNSDTKRDHWLSSHEKEYAAWRDGRWGEP